MVDSQNITYAGLDAHAKTINVAVVSPGWDVAKEQWQINHNPQSLKTLAKKLRSLSAGPILACYEAGPCGYALKRRLDELEIPCEVVAPSLIPVKPGERVKTDRRDARKLATLLKAGLLTFVHPPNEAEEALRDLVRSREDAKKDLMSARHRLSQMLLRYGREFTETKNWTLKHRAWLKGIRFDERWAQLTFDNYLLAIEQIEERIKTLEAAVEEAAANERYAKQAGWLRCLKGVNTVTAMTILAELHDFRRFAHPRDLMAYLGLTPSEHSSGGKVKRGGITKTGNAHARRVLTEAAWNYRHRPTVGATVRKRREGQPPAVIAIADKAQSRLNRRYRRLKEDCGKPHNVVAIAIARELVGFVWAVLNHERLPGAQDAASAAP
jgi:transposase